jgi:hypothetical protein
MDLAGLMTALAAKSEVYIASVPRHLANVLLHATRSVKTGVVKCRFPTLTVENNRASVAENDTEELHLLVHRVTREGGLVTFDVADVIVGIVPMDIAQGVHRFPWNVFREDALAIECVVTVYVENSLMEIVVAPSHLRDEYVYKVRCLALFPMNMVYSVVSKLRYNVFTGMLESKSVPRTLSNTAPPETPGWKPPTCCVCYEATRVRLGCSHHLCVACKNRTAARKRACPICRNPF